MPAQEVKIGQVWADNDERSKPRKIKVIDLTETHAIVETVEFSRYAQMGGGRKHSRIRLDRFNPNRMTGYTLVEDV